MTNLTKRFITGFIGVSIMVGAILWNEYSFSFLFLFIAVMSMREFYSLCIKNNFHPQAWMGIITGIIVFLFFSYFRFFIPTETFIVIIPLVFSIFIRELYTKSREPFINIALTLLGIIYLAMPMGLMNLICQSGLGSVAGTYHPGIVIGYLVLVWTSDSGAYFIGKNFGKRKLFERISPHKTWEGSLGGTFFALIASWVISLCVIEIRFMDWIALSVIVVITGTLGDLVESMFKRSIEIKDSGKILPGHGGFLDRFDAIFISAPFVFTYLQLFC